MNKTLQEGIELAKELNEALANETPNCDVIICTPFIHLASVTPLVDAAKIGVGAENCADKVSGAYTGEVSAAMVASTGAKYVILGHSERRAYYGETVEILDEKVKLALANGLTPIFCIGEVLEEREANKQNEVVAAQMEIRELPQRHSRDSRRLDSRARTPAYRCKRRRSGRWRISDSVH